MNNIRVTSRLAYRNLLSSGVLKTMKEQVYGRICLSPATIREISNDLGMTPNIVSPRIDELRKDGVVLFTGKRMCQQTGRLAMEWSSVDTEPQQEMFL